MKNLLILLTSALLLYSCVVDHKSNGNDIVKYLAESNEEEFQHLDSLRKHCANSIGIDLLGEELKIIYDYHPKIQSILTGEGDSNEISEIKADLKMFLDSVDYQWLLRSKIIVKELPPNNNEFLELAELERKVIEYCQVQFFDNFLKYLDEESDVFIFPDIYDQSEDSLKYFVGIGRDFDVHPKVESINGKEFMGSQKWEGGFITHLNLKYNSLRALKLNVPQVSLQGGSTIYFIELDPIPQRIK